MGFPSREIEPRKYVLVRELPTGEADVDEEPLVELHVTQIGKLLVEVATGHIIKTVVPLPGGRTQTYIMYDASASDDEIESFSQTWTETEVLEEVERVTDPDYGAVVKFCLGKKGKYWHRARKCTGKARDLARHEILTEYYLKVYKPLRDRVEGEGLEGRGPLAMQRGTEYDEGTE